MRIKYELILLWNMHCKVLSCFINCHEFWGHGHDLKTDIYEFIINTFIHDEDKIRIEE